MHTLRQFRRSAGLEPDSDFGRFRLKSCCSECPPTWLGHLVRVIQFGFWQPPIGRFKCLTRPRPSLVRPQKRPDAASLMSAFSRASPLRQIVQPLSAEPPRTIFNRLTPSHAAGEAIYGSSLSQGGIVPVTSLPSRTFAAGRAQYCRYISDKETRVTDIFRYHSGRTQTGNHLCVTL